MQQAPGVGCEEEGRREWQCHRRAAHAPRRRVQNNLFPKRAAFPTGERPEGGTGQDDARDPEASLSQACTRAVCARRSMFSQLGR